MDVDELPIVGVGVDYGKVGPIHAKKTLALVNHFLTYTSHFLNKFANVCEEKLQDLNGKIQQMEVMLCILEAKLASIPGLENVTLATNEVSIENNVSNSELPQPQREEEPKVINEIVQENIPPPQQKSEEPTNVVTVAQDPRYAGYLKMIQVGVPLGAIRQKMIIEGLDPDLLKNPEAIIDNNTNIDVPEKETKRDDDSDFASVSSDSFSD